MRGIVRGGYCLFARSPISALFAIPDHRPVDSLQRTRAEKDGEIKKLNILRDSYQVVKPFASNDVLFGNILDSFSLSSRGCIATTVFKASDLSIGFME